jgi:glutamine synthetase
MDRGGRDIDAWIGFEQEYTLMAHGRPFGFPAAGEPEPQGPYYCSVGTGTVFGRDFVERHTRACIDAGLAIFGTNGEVMPGQWEFQLGYRGIAGEAVDPLTISDQLWIARWLLDRIGESFGLEASLSNKPAAGDWNGAGCHTNFSTRTMRSEKGLAAIEAAIEKMSRKHDVHIQVYGHDLASRLTGAHETCHIGDFRHGVSDRGSSIRIPLHVKQEGRGYFEDRRPGANCDPYQVATRLIKTICDLQEDSYELGDWSLDAILTAGR